MIYILVEHFLNPAGKEFFPDWVLLAEVKLMNYSGFISVELLKDVNDLERTLVCLKFQSEEELVIWAKSEDHKQLLETLSEYMLQKQQSQIL